MEQNLVLIFPPLANPTYIPIGIASLAAYLKQELPALNLDVLDLNLDIWHSVLQQHHESRQIHFFLRNEAQTFYNEELYLLNHRRIWQELKGPLDVLQRQCKLYLEQNEIAETLKQWLIRATTQIQSKCPDRIGISILYPQQLFFALSLARYLKEVLQAETRYGAPLKIFLGGATLSAVDSHELLCASAFIDAIVLGEGETGFKQLLTGVPYESVPGLIYRVSEMSLPEMRNIKQNPPAPACELVSLPQPDFTCLPIKNYFNPQPVLPVLFSRGCRWRKCRFCAHNFSFARYRHKTLAGLIAELQHYYESLGVEHFYFADQYLGADALDQIAMGLIERKLPVAFHFMGRPAGSYDPTLLRKLFQAGCRWISWGIESGSQPLLDIVNKGTARPEIKQILKNAHDCGINNLAMMIFGLPTSTEEDLNATFEFLDSSAPFINAMTESEFVLYKHTPFANAADKYNLQVLGEELLCRINDLPVHSHRLTYQSATDPAYELAWWRRRKPWIFAPSIFDKLNAEHYLLFANHRSQMNQPLI